VRLHLPALPGRPVTRDNSTCAYSGKVRRFAQMMAARGHEVILYCDGRTDLADTENVSVVKAWPEMEPLPFDASWAEANMSGARNVYDRRRDAEDIVGIIGGARQKELADFVGAPMTVEYGVGYSGTFAAYRVFESYAWYHAVTTMNTDPMFEAADPPYWNDTVIPNYFDPADFQLGEGRGDFLLYLGRLDRRKGSLAAAQIAEAAGVPLILAGAGPDKPDYGECVGVVGPEERSDLLGRALAVIQPTIYLEPFGGSVIEAHLCGTPTLTPDVGAFTETVQTGFNGWRCRTLGDYLDGIEFARHVNRAAGSELMRERAIECYGMEAIAPRYERYLEHVIGGRGFEDDRRSAGACSARG
jgi:glycosyltransferase involved in cell wall biosynthesis